MMRNPFQPKDLNANRNNGPRRAVLSPEDLFAAGGLGFKETLEVLFKPATDILPWQ
jgi:hypothetical protein